MTRTGHVPTREPLSDILQKVARVRLQPQPRALTSWPGLLHGATAAHAPARGHPAPGASVERANPGQDVWGAGCPPSQGVARGSVRIGVATTDSVCGDRTLAGTPAAPEPTVRNPVLAASGGPPMHTWYRAAAGEPGARASCPRPECHLRAPPGGSSGGQHALFVKVFRARARKVSPARALGCTGVYGFPVATDCRSAFRRTCRCRHQPTLLHPWILPAMDPPRGRVRRNRRGQDALAPRAGSSAGAARYRKSAESCRRAPAAKP